MVRDVPASLGGNSQSLSNLQMVTLRTIHAVRNSTRIKVLALHVASRSLILGTIYVSQVLPGVSPEHRVKSSPQRLMCSTLPRQSLQSIAFNNIWA